MKDVKFRAWDKQFKIWVNPEIISMWAIFNLENSDSITHDIMQFTGSKDKNDTEIYEGDIVRSPYHKNNFEIIFEDGSFWIVTKTEHLGVGYLNKVQILKFQLEVIGNIYENPELLEGDYVGL